MVSRDALIATIRALISFGAIKDFHDSSLARRHPRRNIPQEFQRHHRDPVRLQREVRARQDQRADQARPRPLLGRLLPGQLRVHPADAGRGRRPARRAGALPGDGRPADADPRPDDRADDDDRRRQEGPQDHRRRDRRPGVQQLQRGRRDAAAPADDAPAVLPGLQAARRQGRRGRRDPAGEDGVSHHRGRAARYSRQRRRGFTH